MRLCAARVSLWSALSVLAVPSTVAQETWRGLTVASEHRCSHYDSDQYRYSQSVEPRIVRSMGGRVYGPYTQRTFASTSDTDIEHIVARSEAHDSGLCRASATTKRAFANDLLNLTLASPSVNRHLKSDKDAAQWLPDSNKCWFVNRIIQVRQKYGLTIDQREANAIDRVLSSCDSTEMVVVASAPMTTTSRTRSTSQSRDSAALRQYDDNNNGRITCAEAKAHGIAPVRRGHPAYEYMRDGDGDGTVCE